MPLAAVVARADITAKADAYVASTYSGHPAACAAAAKTIEILHRDRLFDHANELGTYGLDRLRGMMKKHRAIGDVRGKGLWLAAEFVKDRRTRDKDYETAARVNDECLKNGLYLIHDSISWFLRIQPPLNIQKALFAQGMDILDDAISKATRSA